MPSSHTASSTKHRPCMVQHRSQHQHHTHTTTTTTHSRPHVHVHTVCTHACTHTHSTNTPPHPHTHACTHACTHTHTHAYHPKTNLQNKIPHPIQRKSRRQANLSNVIWIWVSFVQSQNALQDLRQLFIQLVLLHNVGHVTLSLIHI